MNLIMCLPNNKFIYISYIRNLKFILEKKVLTVMVNNSTNINKTNNHLSSQLNTKKFTTYDVGNPGPGLE